MRKGLLWVLVVCLVLTGCAGGRGADSELEESSEPPEAPPQMGVMVTDGLKWEVTVDSFEFVDEIVYDSEKTMIPENGGKLLMVTMTVKKIMNGNAEFFSSFYKKDTYKYATILFNGREYDSVWAINHPDTLVSVEFQQGETKTGFIVFNATSAMEAEGADLQLLIHNLMLDGTTVSIPLDPALNP